MDLFEIFQESFLKIFTIMMSYSERQIGNLTISDGVIENCEKDVYWFFDACLIFSSFIATIILAFLIKRHSCLPNCCKGHPGVPQPMVILDSHKYAFEYTITFLIMTHDLLGMINKEYNFGTPVEKVLIKFLFAFIYSLKYFPIMFAISNKYLTGYIIALILMSFFLIESILEFMVNNECLYGTKKIPNLVVRSIEAIYHIIMIIIFIYRIFKYCVNKNDRYDEVKHKQRKHTKYVKNLFNRNKINLNDADKKLSFTKVRNNIQNKIYPRISGFDYPPRLIIGQVVGLYLAFRFVMFQIDDLTPTIFDTFSHLRREMLKFDTNIKQSFSIIFASNATLYSKLQLTQAYVYLIYFYIELIVVCVILSFIVAFLNSSLNIFFTVKNYRSNFIRSIQKGIKSLLPDHDYEYKPMTVAKGYVVYMGFQVAYIWWATLIMTTFLLLLLFIVFGVILIPLFCVQNSIWFQMIVKYGPAVGISFILGTLQTLLIRFVFVAERGKLMLIENRRWFSVYCYFSFFLNSIIGIFSIFKLIIIWIIYGLLTIARFDFCSLPGFLWNLDSGYNCFIGTLYMELYHHSPVLRYFVDQLQISEPNRRNLKWRNKWHVAYTLINNPQLIYSRKVNFKSMMLQMTVDA